MTKHDIAMTLALEIKKQHLAGRDSQRLADAAKKKADRAYTGSAELRVHLQEYTTYTDEAQTFRSYEHGLWIAASALGVTDQVTTLALSFVEE